jgi:hypothetical protein
MYGEKWSSLLRRSRIEHLGDVRMVHHRQRLPLRLEARNNLLGVHAQLDDFQRHAPAHGFGLLRDINHAASAFADPLQQFVASNRLAHGFVCIPARRIHRDGPDQITLAKTGRGFQERIAGIVGFEQHFQALAQAGITVAGAIEECRALGGREFRHRPEKGFFAVRIRLRL